MFIHSPVVKLRAIALLLGGFTAYMVAVLNPFTVSATQSGIILIWIFDIVLIGIMGVSYYMWSAAPQAPPAELPDSSKWHGPNEISKGLRTRNAVIAVMLTSYGTYGLYVGDLYLPGTRGNGIHLSGIGAWLMFGAMLSATVKLVSVVIDHYDKRNNELIYAHISATAEWLGWTLFILALVTVLFR